MPDRLYRIIYMSRNLITGNADEVAAQIDSILATSRRNNAPDGVGGVLMFNNGCFLQVLEGSSAAVSVTFERIQRDNRHDQVIVLEASYPEERCFVDWSMAFVGADRGDARRYDGLKFDRARLAILAKDELLSQLQALVGEEEVRRAA